MKTIVFDIWGEWGHFRKFYTTSSPLTFSVIPPTAAMGVIGAILGLSQEENQYLKILRKSGVQIGIGLIHPVKKMTMGINLINTKNNVWIPKQRKEGARSPIRYEFLRDAKFRLYVTLLDEDLYTQLKERLLHHETVYTLSLGLSELLANFAFVDEVDAQYLEGGAEPVELHSIIPLSILEPRSVSFTPGVHYKKERLPIVMDEHRVVSRYEECLLEATGKPIVAKVKGYWEGNGHRFHLFSMQ